MANVIGCPEIDDTAPDSGGESSESHAELEERSPSSCLLKMDLQIDSHCLLRER